MGESELRGELSASSLVLEPLKGLSGPSEREEVVNASYMYTFGGMVWMYSIQKHIHVL